MNYLSTSSCDQLSTFKIHRVRFWKKIIKKENRKEKKKGTSEIINLSGRCEILHDCLVREAEIFQLILVLRKAAVALSTCWCTSSAHETTHYWGFFRNAGNKWGFFSIFLHDWGQMFAIVGGTECTWRCQNSPSSSSLSTWWNTLGSAASCFLSLSNCAR